MTVGIMQMPADFRYKSVFLKGRPVHGDSFKRKHPAMDPGRRAKIFSPFDALRGFDEAVAAKETVYTDRPELDGDARERLNRQLSALREMTRGRAGKKARPCVQVTFFVPCTDPDNFACGIRGQIVTVKGICRRVDAEILRAVTVGERVIPFDDILYLGAEGLFDGGGETDGQ